MRVFGIFLALALLPWTLSTASQTTQRSLEGDWVGEVRIDKETISITVHFKRGPDASTPAGLMVGTVDMLDQKDLALKNISVNAGRVHFEVPTTSGSFVFDGQLKTFFTISGEIQRDAKRGSFDLIRTAKVDPETLEQYVGTYELTPNHIVAINRSPAFGLTFLDYETGDLRNLTSLSDTSFSFGPALFVPVPIEASVSFAKAPGSPEIRGFVLKSGDSSSGEFARRLKFKLEEVTFRNGDIALSATLVLPHGKGPFPAVVRTHGSGKALRNISQGEWFAHYGIAFLTYDKRGSGKSTGDVQQANISDLADDALAAVEFLKTRREIDSRQIGLSGGSEGGWVVPLATSRTNDVAFILVGAASALSLGETIVYEVGMVGRQNGFSEEEINQMKAIRGIYNDAIMTGEGWDLLRRVIEESKDKRWFRDARVPQALPATIPKRAVETARRQLDFDPAPIWERTTIPVFAVWGDLDRNVPARQSAVRLTQYLKKAGNTDNHLIVYARGNHEGLEAETGYDQEYPRLKRYVPGQFSTLIDWVLKHVTRAEVTFSQALRVVSFES